MQNTLDLGHLSKEDKLRIMEAIWEDLSKESDEIESPQWHQKALHDTEKKLNSGAETVVDWQTAKNDLRKRFE